VNADVLVGFDTADDAGVFRLDEERALVQTVDFFAPMVDDPRIFGAIAATNALSDVYAMGGAPVTALSIACFPDHQDLLEMLSEIMLGGAEKLQEAGVALLGGHTINDREIKFGYAITGLVNPQRMLTNASAQPGDALVLTKPLGIGIITTAIKHALAQPETTRKAVHIMTTLNRTAAEVIAACRCHAATDITGFGLLGHGCEMAQASRVTLRLHSGSIPYLEDAFAFAAAGIMPGLIEKTWKTIESKVYINPEIAVPLRNILLDPQTSGGLLAAVHPDDRQAVLENLHLNGVEAACIGSVETAQDVSIIVE
jgi:selenide,water dikinase